MLLSAVSVLVVAQSSSEIPEGIMNNPVYIPHSIFHLARLLYVRPETFGPYYVHMPVYKSYHHHNQIDFSAFLFLYLMFIYLYFSFVNSVHYI